MCVACQALNGFLRGFGTDWQKSRCFFIRVTSVKKKPRGTKGGNKEEHTFFEKQWIFGGHIGIMKEIGHGALLRQTGNLYITEVIFLKVLLKRTAAAALCLLLCLSAASAGLSVVSAAQAATVTVETVSAKPGETVSLALSISQVNQIGGAGFYIQYDADVLECTDAVKEGLLSQMEMSSANSAPVGHPGEIWLTGMSLNGVSGSGNLMTVTFRVKDDAASGFSAVTFTDKKQELYESDGNTAVDITQVSGGVQIVAGGAEDPTPTTEQQPTTPTQAPLTTTAASSVTTVAPQPAPTVSGGAIVVTDVNGAAVTRENGATVTVQPEVTVTRPDGTVETQAGGEELRIPGAALVLSSEKTNPGGTVTMKLMLSEVTDITNISIHLAYDTKSMAFIGGEFTGFVRESMSMVSVVGSTPEQSAPAAGDEIILTAANSTPVGGSGVIAQLRFRVYSNTSAGAYAVTFSQSPQVLMQMAAQIPTEGIAGSVVVEGEAIGGFDNPSDGLSVWVYVLIGIVAAAAIVVIVLVIRKKASVPQKTAASAASGEALREDLTPPAADPMTDISEDELPDDASDDTPDTNE